MTARRAVRYRGAVLTFACAVFWTASAAAQGNAFTYQGRLKNGSAAASGAYDFQFKLFDALTGGSQLGSTLVFDGVGADPAPITVSAGLFTVQLNFGNHYPGASRFLEIAVRPHASGSYTTLTPRQTLTPSPYAITAGSVALPYADSVNAASDAFAIANTGNGDGIHGTGNNGVHGESPIASGNGVLGVCDVGSAAYGVWGESSTGIGVVGTQTSNFNFGELGTANNGLYAFSSTGPGVQAVASGSGLNHVALRADNQDAAGIAIWGTNSSSDSNLVVTNSGSGDLIRGFSGPSGGNLVFQVLNNGYTIVAALQITGGADLAEHFAMAEQVQPGMVVEIDPDHAGQLRLSHGAYNPRVAGVISGANKLSAGVVLSDGKPGQQDQPVALSGRVWVYCDASARAIAPGDLLTTSERPGYAMPVADYGRAQGATLGKAMSRLEQGQSGLVLVLVNLQ